MNITLTVVREFAKEKGLHIMFRNQGDNQFTIFIYDKRKQKNYLIGFDCSRYYDDGLSKCCEQAYEYIKNYK